MCGHFFSFPRMRGIRRRAAIDDLRRRTREPWCRRLEIARMSTPSDNRIDHTGEWDSLAEGNWSLVISPSLLLRVGNNYEFAVNRNDSRFAVREISQENRVLRFSLFLPSPFLLPNLSSCSLSVCVREKRTRGQTQRAKPLYRSIIYTLLFFSAEKRPCRRPAKSHCFPTYGQFDCANEKWESSKTKPTGVGFRLRRRGGKKGERRELNGIQKRS